MSAIKRAIELLNNYIVSNDRETLVEANHLLEKVLDTNYVTAFRQKEHKITCLKCGKTVLCKNKSAKKYCDICNEHRKIARQREYNKARSNRNK
jgi:hypothetical protein